MVRKIYRMIAKVNAMLGKVLGIITAGVFFGAAAVEISGYLARDHSDKEQEGQPAPEAVDPDVSETKEHDKTSPCQGGTEVYT